MPQSQQLKDLKAQRRQIQQQIETLEGDDIPDESQEAELDALHDQLRGIQQQMKDARKSERAARKGGGGTSQP